MTSLSKTQMQQDIDFLVNRAMRAGHFTMDKKRCTGVSSNELVLLAYTGRHRGAGCMPHDRNDAAACVRTWRMLPEHRQTDQVRDKMIEGIKRVEDYMSRRGETPQHWSEFMAGVSHDEGTP